MQPLECLGDGTVFGTEIAHLDPRGRSAGADLRPDPAPGVGNGEDQRGRRPPPQGVAERPVVDAPIETTDDEREAAAGERGEGGGRRTHVGGQAVVDELDAVHHTHRPQAAGEAAEVFCRGGERLVVHPRNAEGAQAGAGDEGVGDVVVPDEAETADPVRGGRGGVDPLHTGAELVPPGAKQRIGAIGDGQRRAGRRHSDSLSVK